MFLTHFECRCALGVDSECRLMTCEYVIFGDHESAKQRRCVNTALYAGAGTIFFVQPIWIQLYTGSLHLEVVGIERESQLVFHYTTTVNSDAVT